MHDLLAPVRRQPVDPDQPLAHDKEGVAALSGLEQQLAGLQRHLARQPGDLAQQPWRELAEVRQRRQRHREAPALSRES
ncbi:MAG TPA: hypothetical protein VFD43_01125 [Planctomycetota bacterium]|nr:hypothetical protein [Planctomycetota bacterium]